MFKGEMGDGCFGVMCVWCKMVGVVYLMFEWNWFCWWLVSNLFKNEWVEKL